MKSNILKKWLLDIRQLTYPAAFRIHDRKANDGAQLVEILEQIKVMAREAYSAPLNKEVSAIEDEAFMIKLSIRLWRIKTKLLDRESGAPIKGTEACSQQVERLIGELEKIGIRIEDKTGDLYDPGMTLNVIASEPVEGIDRDIIKETVEPGVYSEGRLINRSQVIVGIPFDDKDETEK